MADALTRPAFPTPPTVTGWIHLSSTGRFLPSLMYIGAQVMQGRGEIGLLAGEDGLVFHFTPDAVDRIGRQELDDVGEIWIVTKDLPRED